MTEPEKLDSLIRVRPQVEMFKTKVGSSNLEHGNHVIKKLRLCEQCNETFPTDAEKLHHMCKRFRPQPTEVLRYTKNPNPSSMQSEFVKDETQSSDGSLAYFAETILEPPINPPVKNVLTDLEKKELENKTEVEEAIKSRPNPKSKEGVEGIECGTCGKVMRSHASLALHLKSHFRDQKYFCQYCEKYFSVSEYYARHLRAHPKDKPHYCDICSKWFSQQITLFLHKRIHTGERPYQCTYCKKSFRILDFLKKHIRCHTGERPYKCRICNKTFTQKSSVNIHTRNAHKFQAQIEGKREEVELQSPSTTDPGEIFLGDV